MLFAVWTALAWAGEDFATLLDPSGWATVATVNPAGDEITVQTKTVRGLTCVRGLVRVEVPTAPLLDVVTDIQSQPAWSSERLLASELLSGPGDEADYWQLLDVPDWTLVSDRFWVMNGRTVRAGGTARYEFERLPGWSGRYPKLAGRIAAQYPGAVEPEPLYGAWEFTPAGAGTDARYHLCSDLGSSIPAWVQRAAATRTLPGTVADVLREARRRLVR